MYQLTILSLRHPRATILILALVTALLSSGTPHLRKEFGYRVLIGDDHPAIQTLQRFIDRFGLALPAKIIWSCGDSQPCGNAFDSSSLEMADAITHQLTGLGFVRRVTGIANAPLLVPDDDGFTVRRFVEEGVVTEDVAELADRAVADPFWLGTLVSRDARVGAIVVQGVDNDAATDLNLLTKIEESLAPFESQGFTYHLVGAVPASVISGRELSQSTTRLLPFTVTIIGLVILGLFRSWRSTLVALATVGVALFWTFGLLGWLGWPQDAILEILAPLILIVGVCDSVHLLARFGSECAVQEAIGPAAREDAMLNAARDVGPICLLTTLTTGVAFLSFVMSPLDTFDRFGLIATFGVLFCLALTFSLLPIAGCWLNVFGKRRRRTEASWERVTSFVMYVCDKHAAVVLVMSGGLFLIGGAGWLGRLQVDVDFLEMFGENSQVMRAIRFAEEHLEPSENLELEITIGAGDAVEDPATLRAVQSFADSAAQIEGLDRPISLVDLIARVNRLLHYDDPRFETIGTTRASNAEILELVALEDPVSLGSWVSTDRSSLRVSLSGVDRPTSERREVLRSVRQLAAAILPDGWKVALTGNLPLGFQWVDDVQSTQLRSLPTAVVLVLGMMSLFFRSAGLSLLAMAPTLLPVALTLGVMGWVGMNLDVGRAMIGVVVIGVGVDDAIHLLARYQVLRRKGESPVTAIDGAVHHLGAAIITTSLALALGFLTLTASAWQTISSFGLFVAIAILGAMGATLLLIPSVVLVYARRRAAPRQSAA